MPKQCPLCEGVGHDEGLNGQVPLLRCEGCGFVYADAADDDVDRANFHYDHDTVEEYRRIQSGYDVAWFDWTAKRLARGTAGGRVLDIGCGNCLLLQSFERIGWLCYGLDPSPWAAKCGQQRGYTVYRTAADVPAEAFDLVVATSTLEHVARPRELAAFALRCLRKGALSYWTIPNYGSVSLRLHLAELPPQPTPMHCVFFTGQTLRRLFTSPGIAEEVEWVKVRSYGLPELYKVWKRMRLRRPMTQVPDAAPAATDQGDDKRLALARSLRAKAVVRSYYWLGRPFLWGDKLEAIVKKADR